MMKSDDGVALTSDDQTQTTVEIASRLKEVESLLLKKLKSQALIVALRSPPSGSKSETIKDAEMSEAIDLLDLESCDVLMKYVYKFMGKLQNCALMLKLHAQLCEKAGSGSIIRVLTDRKQV